MDYGACYYPDDLPAEEWPRDLRAAREAGMTVLRVADAAWSKLESAPGAFTFDWLDGFLDVCVAHGLSVVMCTPTLVPPSWLVAAEPEILPQRSDGRRSPVGGWHHGCLNTEAFRTAVVRICEAMATHLGRRPEIVGWQLHNEIALSPSCHCSKCHQAWAGWLANRYVTIDQLNDAWGTNVWSREFTDWEQVPIPDTHAQQPVGGHILPLVLAHARFRNDVIGGFLELQARTVRPLVRQSAWISHNFIANQLRGVRPEGFVDPFGVPEGLTRTAWDNYPQLAIGGWAAVALDQRAYRGTLPDRHWVLEQVGGGIGDGERAWTPALAPGQLRRWVLHSYGHGADGVLFWPLRSRAGGNLPYWEGILDVDGYRGRRYEEAAKVGEQLRELSRNDGAEDGPVGSGDVSLIVDVDSVRAGLHDSVTDDYSVPGHLAAWYRGLVSVGARPRVTNLEGALADPVDVLALPVQLALSDEDAERLRQFVERGGVLLCGPRLGRYDHEGRFRGGVGPRACLDWLGLRTDGLDPLDSGRRATLAFEDGGDQADATWFAEILVDDKHDVLASYASSVWYAGGPAVVGRHLGEGYVVYCGTPLVGDALEGLLRTLQRDGWLASGCELPPDVEVLRRGGELLVANHGDATVDLPEWVREMTRGTVEAVSPHQIIVQPVRDPAVTK